MYVVRQKGWKPAKCDHSNERQWPVYYSVVVCFCFSIFCAMKKGIFLNGNEKFEDSTRDIPLLFFSVVKAAVVATSNFHHYFQGFSWNYLKMTDLIIFWYSFFVIREILKNLLKPSVLLIDILFWRLVFYLFIYFQVVTDANIVANNFPEPPVK